MLSTETLWNASLELAKALREDPMGEEKVWEHDWRTKW